MSAEYIGQLEGEVAVKAQEAHDLRVQNQQLREENTRLTDLTRMLLSSQAFSGFLQELSQSGGPPANLQKSLQLSKPAPTQLQVPPPPIPIKKDVSASEAAAQLHVQQPQIGMALIPETPLDFSALQPANGWMSTTPNNDFQIYSVTELPAPPTLDLTALSGKPSTKSNASAAKKEFPTLPQPPVKSLNIAEPISSHIDESMELDRSAFALYFDQPSAEITADLNVSSASDITSPEERLGHLEHMCSDLDELCENIERQIE
jgi:bZIP-type transcription factor MBZ1